MQRQGGVPDNPRAIKLKKILDDVLFGRTEVNKHNYSLFIEAICARLSPTECISRLISHQPGLISIQASFTFDPSLKFLNGSATDLLRYLQAPELLTIGGGDFLRKILICIVEPPFFWHKFAKAYEDGLLHGDGCISYAWLLLQLISLDRDIAKPYRELAQKPRMLDSLLNSSQIEIRNIGSKIKHILITSGPSAVVSDDFGPGGRHDNDFMDFRDISILPTADEIICTEPPFLRQSSLLEDSDSEDNRLAAYLDNQFRLLREDMLCEMREEIHIVLGKKKRPLRNFVVDGLRPLGIYISDDTQKRRKWGITFECLQDLPQFLKDRPKDRMAYLNDNRKIFRHQSQACLIVDGEVVAFPTVNRVEDLLAKELPILVLQLEGETSITKTLLKLKTASHIKLVQIDSAIFSFEPILNAIKDIQVIPLSPELLFWKQGSDISIPSSQLSTVVESIRINRHRDLQGVIGTSKPILLDHSQADSLLAGLTQKVSLIQGPPGTGKSFIGALLAKVLHDHTAQTILVVCYTNHALDQFLEDLLDIGIPEQSIVRLGSKHTTRTEALSLQKQGTNFRLVRVDWTIIESLRATAITLGASLTTAFKRFMLSRVTHMELLEHLEFVEAVYYEAFCVPKSTGGMTTVGRGGQAISDIYLLDRWASGKNAGIFAQSDVVTNAPDVWGMRYADRQAKMKSWGAEILKEQAQHISTLGRDYNRCMHDLSRKFSEKDAATLNSKRIIGCTTTAAAMYRESIQAASPDILLVEEAGEILESHVLTALCPQTTQLILIGDHKQLRPKVNNYLLTVEKGEGYDLNRSLFERLVLKGYPHKTLTQQHRMRPEISALIRQLTYPDLIDADSTKGRPDLLGLQDNIVFIHHDHPEDELTEVADRRDLTSSSSKQNTYEVEMVLKIVRYLAQQGYGTEKLVILTPYLGQLHKLRDALKKDNDPVLNDLDSYDLVRAGLLPAATASVNKKSIRLATIDNYQGEESDIVIGSLTRSNPNCDIGFMSSPERLNVLLSRARNGLILLGNSSTFLGARKGKDLWNNFFALLKAGKHIYGGVPVKCERHQGRNALLSQAIDFDTECPDGGCKEPCTVILNCGVHTCPSKCHQLYDHSKMPCEQIRDMKCPKGHLRSWKCHESPPSICFKCERETKLAEQKKAKAVALQRKRDAEALAHAQRLADIDEKIAAEAEAHRDRQLAEDRTRAIQQKQKDLETAISRTSQAAAAPPITAGGSDEHSPPAASKSGPGTSRPVSLSQNITTRNPPKAAKPPTSPTESEAISPSQKDWQRRKEIDGASNGAIDSIMELVGLEDVKQQVLRIYAKIEVTKRQGISLKDERFNIVLLGNPGTGKTTVARHYAKFLSSVEVLPGSEFIETTGSRLANEGVAGIKKHLETLINAGGGAIFVDETYQLTGEHNFQGSQVLDFMLAEMENHIGTIVFIFAGYDKEMEKFFEHNPGLTSRVPYKLHFADYSDGELLSMFHQLIQKKYGGRMKVEDGVRGLYVRIAIRRLGRGRGRDGFGNARALRNLFAKVAERQAQRLHKERRQGLTPDDFVLLKQDLIGPDPSEAIVESAAWRKLQSLIGLAAVKQSIRNFFDLINTNYQRELVEKEPVQVSLNRVFLGSPGTGKTTVAKLYGQILSDLGLLTGSEVVTKNPADFIGSVMGESEKNTKDILANTVGKVLIIDEAYMLYGGSSTGTGNQNDPYKTAVIDTIVAEVQSVPGEDRCVLLLGYKDQIVDMFQNVNPGLSRRFAIENAFHFDDFSDTELLEVLNMKLKDQDLGATAEAVTVAIEVLSRSRNRPNFGNAGEVENLLGQAKTRYQTRQTLLPVDERNFDVVFDSQDFDPDYDRSAHASTNLQKLFEDVVGCEDIVRRLGEYQQVAGALKARNIDARGEVPMNFVFKGPPGTGKTTTARKMGQVYFDMGFLSSLEVVECSASDLIGQYVGQTGPKTQKLFEKALGRVLFIDEAYRLSEGHFAKEAIDELVGALTQEKFKSKIVVILAGYDREMNELMAVNTGLSSRFPDEIIFRNMEPEHCLEVLKRELKKKNICLKTLDRPALPEYSAMLARIKALSCLPSWGNARDITTLSRKMVNIVYKKLNSSDNSVVLELSANDALACMTAMLNERQERVRNLPTRKQLDIFGGMQQMPDAPTLSRPAAEAKAKAKTAFPKLIQDVPHEVHSDRDAGVSDESWLQLQLDKEASAIAAKQSEENTRQLELELEETIKREEAQQALVKKTKLDEASARDRLERDRLRRLHEELRIQEAEDRMERKRVTALLEQEREIKRREAKVQQKLRMMGVCVAGYRWIKQMSGYRCAGGSHFVDNAALGI